MAYENKNGFAFFSRNNSENPKAPLYKGFVKLTPELLVYIQEAEQDSEGCVMLDCSLWKDQEKNAIKGTVTEPFKKGQQKGNNSKPAGKPKQQASSDDF